MSMVFLASGQYEHVLRGCLCERKSLGNHHICTACSFHEQRKYVAEDRICAWTEQSKDDKVEFFSFDNNCDMQHHQHLEPEHDSKALIFRSSQQTFSVHSHRTVLLRAVDHRVGCLQIERFSRILFFGFYSSLETSFFGYHLSHAMLSFPTGKDGT